MSIDLQYSATALVYAPASLEDQLATAIPDVGGRVRVDLHYDEKPL
jgi:hypothetical protein